MFCINPANYCQESLNFQTTHTAGGNLCYISMTLILRIILNDELKHMKYEKHVIAPFFSSKACIFAKEAIFSTNVHFNLQNVTFHNVRSEFDAAEEDAFTLGFLKHAECDHFEGP